MITKEELNEFWKKEIESRFDQKALNYQVRILNGEWVRYVNLDNAATTIPFLRVKEEVDKELDEYGSVHRGAGEKSKISTERYEEARRTVRNFVNSEKDNYVIFTPNTTGGMNQLAYFFSQIRGKVMVSDIEHSSSYLPWIFQEGLKRTTEQVDLEDALEGKPEDLNSEMLERGLENVIKYKTKEDFTFDLADIERVLKEQASKGKDERVKVLVVTGASNVTGYKPPLKKLADLARTYGAMIGVDACQLLQHEKIDMQNQGLDFVVFSGHKMYAPYGSGAIVGDRRVFDAFWPYQIGGGNVTYVNQEGKVIRQKENQAHDPGTPNFAGARSLYYAIKELESIGMDRIAEYEHTLVEYAFSGLEKIEKVRLYVGRNEDGTFDRSLMTLNIDGMEHKLVAEILDREYGIGVRAGSYCVYEYSRRNKGTTHEQDIDITEEAEAGITANIPGSVRASFCMYNTIEDADRLISAINEIASKGEECHKQRYYIADKKKGDWVSINH